MLIPPLPPTTYGSTCLKASFATRAITTAGLAMTMRYVFVAKARVRKGYGFKWLFSGKV